MLSTSHNKKKKKLGARSQLTEHEEHHARCGVEEETTDVGEGVWGGPAAMHEPARGERTGDGVIICCSWTASAGNGRDCAA